MGAGVVWGVMRRRGEGDRVARAVAEQRVALLEGEVERVRADCERRIGERAQDVQACIRQLRAEFGQAASETVTRGTEALEQRNRRDIGALLEPLRQQMEAFRRAAEEAQKANCSIGDTIRANIDAIGKTAAALGAKADGLAEVLRGSNRHLGVWGEKVLAETLASCGLQEGVHYFAQEGRADRPDVQVVDVQGRWMVIDAKANLTDYIDCCNAAGEAERAKALKRHADAMAAQAKLLAAKNYPAKLKAEHPGRQYLDLTAMFVPSEAAYAAAMAANPRMWYEAYRAGVVMVTPQTLLAYLTVVSLAWKQDTAEKNQLAIVEQARKLLANLRAAMDGVRELGEALRKAGEKYGELERRLTREDAHGLKKPAEELERLGVVVQEKRKGRGAGVSHLEN